MRAWAWAWAVAAGLAAAGGAGAAPAGACEHTVESPWRVADDRGQVCSWDALDHATGCCGGGPSTACGGCDEATRCCPQYEACIACCLGAADVAERAQGPIAATVKDGATFSNPFQFCRHTCRTNSGSTLHENFYLSANRFCYSESRKPADDEVPAYPEGLEVLVGGAGESCDDVCGAKGLQCNRKSLELVNSCHRLEENFECSRCWSVGGQEYPAFSPAFPRQANACLINTKGKLFNCAKKPGFADNSPSAQRNSQAQRLCGCFKVGTDLPHPQFP